MKIIALFFLLFTQAQASSDTRCEKTEVQVISELSRPENRISFANEGGLFNGGVCWWHSRLERAFSYLVVFDPTQAKPTSPELKEKLREVTFMQPVVIPGYQNLQELSSENPKLVQKILNHWQLRDSFINQAWLRGLSGRSHMTSEKLQEHMDEIYLTFEAEKKPYFLILQLPGVFAHAFLLLKMSKISDGYRMEVADSNSPGIVRNFDYHYGMKEMNYYGYDYVPYIQYSVDLKRIKKNLSSVCGDELL